MPKCLTRYHGELEYGESAVVHFTGGLPGFEDEEGFLPIEIPAARPVVFLQSISDPDLCFVTLPVFVIDRDYELDLTPESLEALGLPAGSRPRIGEDVLCLAVITIQEDGPTTANLMAPLVLDMRAGRGVQAIRADDVYSHRHAFLENALGVLCS